MPAHEHLNKQLFHGTNVPFVSGEIVVPMGDIGQDWKEEFPETGKYAHATTDPEYAKVFAMRAHETDSAIGDESKPRVFSVRPLSNIQLDPTDPKKESFRTKDGFEIVKLHSEATPDEESYGGYSF